MNTTLWDSPPTSEKMIWPLLLNQTCEALSTTITAIQSSLNNINSTLNAHMQTAPQKASQPNQLTLIGSLSVTNNTQKYNNSNQNIPSSSTTETSYNRSKSISASLNPTPMPKVDQSLFRWLTSRPTSFSSTYPIIEETDDPTITNNDAHLISNNNIPMAQPSQDEPEPNLSLHTIPWGDPLPTIETSNTLRIIYQNVHHSLQPSLSDPNSLQLVENLQALRCGIFCASETNLNWAHQSNKRNIRQIMERGFIQVHMSTTSSAIGKQKEHLNAKYLPGGAAIFTFDQWASKVTNSGEDERKLGRWAYTTISGKNNHHITIISAYRTHRQGPYAGALTTHAQQVFLIELERLQSNKSSSTAPLPRDECIKDLNTLLQNLQAQNHSIILCIDANETPSESCNSKGIPKSHSIEALLQERGLLQVFTHHHNNIPLSTTTTKDRFLDRVAVWNVPLHHVSLLGVHHPAQSDHLGIAIDIDTNDLFGCQFPPLQQTLLH